jgi:hypothetical protein
VRVLLYLLLAGVVLTEPVFAQQPSYTISQTQGHADGGNVVTITGPFQWQRYPYRVFFGSYEGTLVSGNDQQLVVRTPAHLASTVPVVIFEGDAQIFPGFMFTFVGEAYTFERLLLPVYTVVEGAFGSVFRTDFTASNTGTETVEIFGLQNPCRVSACIEVPLADFPYQLAARSTIDPRGLEQTGAPGQFIFVREGVLDTLPMNLRASDTSRSAENFGTEIPVVRMADYGTDVSGLVTLTGIPTDARFRNKLRIYGIEADELIVTMTGTNFSRTQTVQLSQPPNLFVPAYAELGDFPTAVGELTVQIRVAHEILSPPVSRTIWAFVSVTNNDTQHITTITPQP